MSSTNNAGGGHIRKDVELTFYLRPLELRNFIISRKVKQCLAFMFRIYFALSISVSVGIGIVYPREMGNAKA